MITGLRYSATERGIPEFMDEFLSRARTAIQQDTAFLREGIFARPAGDAPPQSSRSIGLGPKLAESIGTASFEHVAGVDEIRERMDATLESEFNNAYGQCAMACARFTMV